MKLKHFIPTALAALAALAAPAALAAFGYSSGDLYLGFRQVGNTTSDFAVNIGPSGTYRDANDPFSPVVLTIGNLSSQLDSIFNTTGGAWAFDPNVKWGIFGTTSNVANNGDPIRVLYITEPIDNAQPLQQSGQTGTAGNMINAINYYSDGAASGTTSGLTESTVSNGAIGNPGNANSVTTRLFTGTPFGTSNLAQGYDSVTNNLEFYRLPQNSMQTTVTREGTFSISGDTLTYTPVNPVPEPSSSALLFLGTAGLAYIYANKHRKSKTS